MSKNTKGFTLIELLVVVSIIALLVSILLPALNRAREHAKAVKCQAQSKQWATALLAYTSNNEGCIPFFATYYYQDMPAGAFNIYWYDALAGYIGSETGYASTNTGSNFQSDNYFLEIRQCPSGKTDPDDTDEWNGWIGPNYCWDAKSAPFYYHVYSGASRPSLKSDKLRFHQELMAFMDVKRYFVYNPFDTTINCSFVRDADDDGIFDSLIELNGKARDYNLGRPKIHSDACNVTLLDGHVERVSYEELWHVEDGVNNYPSHSYWRMNR